MQLAMVEKLEWFSSRHISRYYPATLLFVSEQQRRGRR